MVGSSTTSTFVGRSREMTELTSALDEALAGRGQVVMLAGEPGIGKTRLLEELAESFPASSGITLRARCREARGAPPYWPWCQVLEQYVEDANSKVVREVLSEHVSVLVNAFPVLSSVTAENPPEDAPELTIDEARFQLFSHFTSFLVSASRNSPLLVIIDNVHWADDDSFGLLEFIAQSIGNEKILVVVAGRSDSQSSSTKLPNTLESLAREPNFHLNSLSRMNADATHELAVSLGMDTSDPALSQAVYTATEGNPFYVREVVSALGSSGSPQNVAPLELISDSARSTITRRLAAVSEGGRKVMDVAAVVGLEVDAGQVVLFCEPENPLGVINWIEEVVAAGIIESQPGRSNQFRFAHALFREALLADMALSTRTQLHATVGQALEQFFGDDAQLHAAELAHHFIEARILLGDSKAIEYALVAGESALRASAPEQAALHLEDALSAKGVHDDERAEIEVKLAQALSGTQRRDDAAVHFRAGFDHFVATGENDRAVEIASYPIYYGFGSSGMRDILDAALEITSEGSVEQAYLLSRRARQVYHENMEYDSASADFKRALSIADQAEDHALKLAVLADYGHVDGDELKYAANLDRLPVTMDLLERFPDRFSEYWAHHAAFDSLFFTGWLGETQEHAEKTLSIAKLDGDRSRMARAYVQQHFLKHALGDLAGALDVARAGLGERGRRGHSALLGGAIVVSAELGDIDTSYDYAARMLETESGSIRGAHDQSAIANSIPVLAAVTNDDDLLQKAETVARDVLQNPRAVPDWTLSAAAGLGLIACRRNDPEMAGEVFSLLAPHAGEFVRPSVFSVDRTLAGLASVTGNAAAAKTHFEAALELCSNGKYVPELARTQADYAGFLVGTGKADDRDRAIELTTAARATAERLGMKPLGARLDELGERAAALPSTIEKRPAGLTAREVEVLQELAAGKSNREIAEALFISQNTVIRHVANIFSKTGSSNRAQAAVYAERSGLQ